MSFTHTLQLGWNNGAGAALNGVSGVTSDNEANQSIVVPPSSTALAKVLEFATGAGKLKSVYILATAAMTLRTYNGATLKDTITLAANVPVVWNASSGQTQPFSNTADVNNLQIDSTPGGNLDIRILYAS